MDERHVATKHAASRLGLNHRTLAAFVRALGLSAVWEAHRLIAVSGDAVAKWEGKILTSGQIGLRHGFSGAAINRRLIQLGISPLMPSSSSQKVSAVWAAADIEQLDFSSQWLSATGRVCSPGNGGQVRLLNTQTGANMGKDVVSLVRLQKTLHLNRDTLSILAKNGFLQPGGHSRAARLRGVTVQSADTFRKTYVSSTEIARKTGLSAIAVTRRILARGVNSVLQDVSSTRYQYCWRRADIRKIDFGMRGDRSIASSRIHAAMDHRATNAQRGAVTFRVAIDYLGTNGPSLRGAFEHGLIRVVKQTLRGGISLLDEHDVRAFSERYVFTPKLSAETGISSFALIKMMHRHCVSPVLSGPKPIHSLWDRDSLQLEDLFGARKIVSIQAQPPASLLL